jgi:hypothetical protein
MNKTLVLTRKFNLLSDEWLKAWEGKVFNHYPEGTPTALAIFPNKRSPFQSGTYEERIIAVSALSDSLAPSEELADVKADVKARYAELQKAREEQKQAMTVTERYTTDLEKQRLVLADALYHNLATLMAKFYKTPKDVERFFDLSLIRRSSAGTDGTFSHGNSVNPGTTLVIDVPKKMELSINAIFIIANSGGGSELHFFFANSASATDSPHKAIVLPDETVEITAGEMGWSTTNTILIVKNMGTLTAEFELTATEAVE